MNAHDCSACHGSGTAREPNIAPTYDERWRCPVCQGSGRISDVRTAEQALVDAETFKAVVVEMWRADPDNTPEAWNLLDNIDEAQGWLSIRGRAGAAFRAVPALREEE